jgi:hypothetical protein
MTETKTKRRGHGDDSIFFSAQRNRYGGDISVGFRADWPEDPAQSLGAYQAGSEGQAQRAACRAQGAQVLHSQAGRR